MKRLILLALAAALSSCAQMRPREVTLSYKVRRKLQTGRADQDESGIAVRWNFDR